jgi:hypothetical protein
MAVDVLLVVADPALGAVLEIALAADGYVVRRAVTEADTRAALAAAPPGVLIVDTTAPFSEDALLWTDQHALATSLILLVPGLGDWPTLSRPSAVILRMPFGREDLRRAFAALGSTGCVLP